MGLKVEDSPQVINPSFAGCCCCPFVVVVVCCCCCCLAGASSLGTEEINIFGVTISVAKVTSV